MTALLTSGGREGFGLSKACSVISIIFCTIYAHMIVFLIFDTSTATTTTGDCILECPYLIPYITH